MADDSVDDQEAANQRLGLVLLAVVSMAGLIGGLALTIGFFWSRAALADKKEQLAEHGVPVTAAVEFHKGGLRTTDVLKISYEYAGVPHQGAIRCAGCDGPPGPTIEIRVDPEHPEEFLAPNGHTDDSASPSKGGRVPVFGVALTLIGGVGGTLAVLSKLQQRRLDRAAGPTSGGRPGRRPGGDPGRRPARRKRPR